MEQIKRQAGEVSESESMSGTARPPLHVTRLAPSAGAVRRLPVVLLHGGFHTGSAYLETPDGRPGWAPLFARRGHPVHVPDWPGHGRSPALADLATLATLGTEAICRSLAVLLEATGPAIVLAHSAAGPMAWWLAEQYPDRVAAVVGIAPGSRANLLRELPDDGLWHVRLALDRAPHPQDLALRLAQGLRGRGPDRLHPAHAGGPCLPPGQDLHPVPPDGQAGQGAPDLRLLAPAGKPADIVEKLNAAIAATLAEPQVAEVMRKRTMVIDRMNPAGYQRFVNSEYERWGSYIRTAGISLDS